MFVQTTSSVARFEATLVSQAKLEALASRQQVQLELEERGERVIGKQRVKKSAAPPQKKQANATGGAHEIEALQVGAPLAAPSSEPSTASKSSPTQDEKPTKSSEPKKQAKAGKQHSRVNARDLAKQKMDDKKKRDPKEPALAEQVLLAFKIWVRRTESKRASRVASMEAEARAAARQVEVERLEAMRLEAIAAASNPSMSRGKWAMSDSTLAYAFLNACRGNAQNGSWILAQTLMQTCKQWRVSGQYWCEQQDELLITAADGIGGCKFGHGVMRIVSRTSPHVRVLRLHGFNNASLADMYLVAPLLEHLELTTTAEVSSVLEGAAFPKLRSLTMTDCSNIAGDGLRHIAEKSRELTTLHVYQSVVGNSILAYSRNLPPMDGALRSFVCTDPLSDETVRALCRACPRLEQLTLHGITTSAAIKQTGLFCQGLQSLRLYGTRASCTWSEADLESLAGGCKGLKQLHLLDAGKCQIDGSALHRFGELVDLSLAYMDADLDGDAFFALAGMDAKLQSLDISHCKLSHLKAISEIVATCSALEGLHLAHVAGVTNGLFVSVGCHRLRHLDLEGTDVNTGISSIVEAACPHLTTLKLTQSALTPTASAVQASRDCETDPTEFAKEMNAGHDFDELPAANSDTIDPIPGDEVTAADVPQTADAC